MVTKIEIHDNVRVYDGESRSDEDTYEFVASEISVLPLCMLVFPSCHTFVSFDDNAGEQSDVDAVVAELAQETAVATVDFTWHGTEVSYIIVEGIAVDMVDDVTIGDRTDEGEILKACEVHRAIPTTERQISRCVFVMLFVRQFLQFDFLPVLRQHVVGFGVQPDDFAFSVARFGLFVAPREEPEA